MNMPSTDVSAIIPVVGPAEHLAESIESVLVQTNPPHEVIVVGTAGASDTVRLFDGSVRFVQTRNTKIWGACNLGVTFSRGTVLAFLGSNDRWRPEKLQVQIDLLQSKPRIDIVLGHSSWMDPTETGDHPGEPGLLAGTMIVHRQSFLRNGFFEEAVHDGVFSTWLSRAKDRGLGMEVVREVVLEKRTPASAIPAQPPAEAAITGPSSTRNGD